MESTSSTAHVEPKTKSQDPAAKAKRLKRLLCSIANPDFAEAVEFERSIVEKYKQFVSECTEHLKERESINAVVQKQIEGLVEVQTDYI
jgi:hypothetical protein